MRPNASKFAKSLLICLLALSMECAVAKTFPDHGSGISITVPDNWDMDDGSFGGYKTHKAKSPNGKLHLYYIVIDADDAKAESAIEKELQKELANLKTTGENDDFELQDELTAICVEGTGNSDTHGQVEFRTLAIENRGEKIILIAMILPGAGDNNALETITKGIRLRR